MKAKVILVGMAILVFISLGYGYTQRKRAENLEQRLKELTVQAEQMKLEAQTQREEAERMRRVAADARNLIQSATEELTKRIQVPQDNQKSE